MQEGVIAKILFEPGTKDVKVGDIIGVMVDEGDDWENVKWENKTFETSKVEEKSPTIEEAPVVSTPQTGATWSFPSVRLLAAQYGIDDISKIPGTGVRGAVTKGDCINYIEKNNLKKITFVPSTESNIKVEKVEKSTPQIESKTPAAPITTS